MHDYVKQIIIINSNNTGDANEYRIYIGIEVMLISTNTSKQDNGNHNNVTLGIGRVLDGTVLY